MSDTKQQCPSCRGYGTRLINADCNNGSSGETVICLQCKGTGYGSPVEGSASSPAAPGGAREWLRKSDAARRIMARVDEGYTEFTGGDVVQLLEAYAESLTAPLRRDNDDLRAFNESLHNLCRKVWEALEPTGEYEGDMKLVEFAKSVRIAKDSAEWSLGRIPELEAKVEAAERELKELREKSNAVMQGLDHYCDYPDHNDPYEGDACPHEFIGLAKCEALRAALRGKEGE